MTTVIMRKLVGVGRSFAPYRSSVSKFSSLWTPDYLETGKSKIPLYDTVNIKLTSYNYPRLESYQSFIDTLADYLDIEIDNSWAFPPVSYKIQRFKPNSSAISTEYELNEYQRNIQVEVSATKFPLLLRSLEASVPEGVTVNVTYYDPSFESKRYVPDTELLSLKEQLSGLKRK